MKKLVSFVRIVLLTIGAFICISGISLLVQAVSGVSQATETPAGTMSTAPELVSSALPAAHPAIMPVLPARSLFKEAKVTAEVSKLASPETFRKVKVSAQILLARTE